MNEIRKLLLSLSVSGSIVALALFALKPLLKYRLSKTWQYYIWLVVIVRLLIPYTPQASIVGELFKRTENYLIAIQETPSNITDFASNPTDEATMFQSDATNANRNGVANPQTLQQTDNEMSKDIFSEIQNNLWLLWIGVAIMLFVRKITSYHSFVRYIKAGMYEVTDIAALDNYKDICTALGIRRPLALYTNKLATSPMLVGIFRPFIVFPNIEVGEKELQNIYIHELTHYKRLDIFYKWLTQFTVCLHWFNPLVYLISREINKNCELSCDEAIIKKLDDNGKRSYGDALLSSLKFNGSYGDTIVSITLSEDARLLNERLCAIMKFGRKSKYTVAFTVFFTALILCGASFTGAYTTAQSSIQANDGKSIFNEADRRGIEIMEQSGTWGVTIEEVLPFMTNAGIDRAIEIYNQKHPGQKKIASDYYYNQTNNPNEEYSQSSQKTEKQFSDNKVSLISFSIIDCANVRVGLSKDKTFKYEYYAQFYDILTTTKNNELTFTIKRKPDTKQFVTGSVENCISISIPDFYYKNIYIDGIRSGIVLDGINTNINISDNEGAIYMYIPEQFDKDISCVSKNGSVVINISEFASNYSIALEKDIDTSFSLHDGLTGYIRDNNTISYVKGNGSANISVNMKAGFFAARLYDIQAGSKIENPKNESHQGIETSPPINMNALNTVDKIAIEFTTSAMEQMPSQYLGIWEIIELYVPDMSENGIDALVEIYNQYTFTDKKEASDYYNKAGESVDIRALTIMQNNGMWKYVEPLFPYMTNAGIDKVVAEYNQKHKGNEKAAYDYYN